MRPELTRHAPWVLPSVIVLVASVVLTPETLPTWYRCPTLALTGLPCPGCGMSHAFIALAHGQFSQAWADNALSFPTFAVVLALPLPPLRRALRALRPKDAVAIITLAWVWNFARILA